VTTLMSGGRSTRGGGRRAFRAGRQTPTARRPIEAVPATSAQRSKEYGIDSVPSGRRVLSGLS
jgi:hypothetical protein